MQVTLHTGYLTGSCSFQHRLVAKNPFLLGIKHIENLKELQKLAFCCLIFMFSVNWVIFS